LAIPHSGNQSDKGMSLRDLDRALAQVPEQQYQVILLISLEGTSYHVRPASRDSINCAGMTFVTAPLGTRSPIIADDRQSTRAGIV
jgi:hypothetical protein